MRRRLTFVVVTAVSLTLALAGCGDEKNSISSPAVDGTSASQAAQGGASSSMPTSSTPTSGAGTGTGGGVEWVNSFCEPVSKFTNQLYAQTSSTYSGPNAVNRALTDDANRTLAVIDTAVTDLKKLGPSPFRGGDILKDTAINDLDMNREMLRLRVDKLRSGQGGSVDQILRDTPSQMTSLSSLAQTTAGATELVQAMQAVPSCKNL